MIILETERLQILEFEKSDAAFILELVNEPAWLKYIGDKNVCDLINARNFIENNLRTSYAKNGFGLFLVQLKDTKEPIGMSGLVNRSGLDDIDIGFSFLARHRRKGYAYESSKAMLAYAENILKIDRIVAITHIDNGDDKPDEIALCTLAAFNLGNIKSLDDIETWMYNAVRGLDTLFDYQEYLLPAASCSLLTRANDET